MEHRITFPKPTEFTQVFKSRVDDHFKSHNKKPTGDIYLYTKAIFGYGVFFASCITLVFYTTHIIPAVLLAFLFAHASIFIAFNATHDAAHGAFSDKKWINTLVAATMDMVGISHFLWKLKHNILHHTFTNIDEKDSDLESFGVLRLSPKQDWRSVYVLQYIYGPILYSFLTLIWFFHDFYVMIRGGIGDNPTPKRTPGVVGYFLLMKVLYIVFMLVIPMMYHNPLIVITFFVAIHLCIGFTISLIFALAHVSSTTEFIGEIHTENMPYEWSEHQLRTTTDFAPQSRFATWYMGGLNYQVVHHLFQQVSHTHYPHIREIVEKTAREYGLPYHCAPSFLEAVRNHFRHLKNMGKKPV